MVFLEFLAASFDDIPNLMIYQSAVPMFVRSLWAIWAVVMVGLSQVEYWNDFDSNKVDIREEL
jgi:hypothetical protein